jgi:hypothetical protein
MKILLSKEEINDHVAFGVEFMQEIRSPDGKRWRCQVFHDSDGELVAECELVDSEQDQPKGA